MPFRNPLALLGLLSIIPLIIIYLIRPRPREILFSATQFLREGEAERSAVLSRLINDPLFWIQLLVLCSLSIAAAGPYTTEDGIASSHLVVVLDASASMEASISQALKLIDPYLDDYEKISIIFAENIPVPMLQEGKLAEARETLGRMKPKAISSDLSSAMIMGSNLLGSDGGNILVASDFISWTGDDPEATRKILQAGGDISIVFADSIQGGENVALVESWDVPGPGYVNHTALVRNYGPGKTVPIIINGPGGASSQTVQIPSDGDYYLTFTAYPGVNEITLDLQDAIAWDNHAYVYVPDIEKKKVLYIGDTGPAMAALRSLPNVRIETSGELGNFDLVVAARNASQNSGLNRYINNGGRVIFIAQDLESPEYLPVRVTGDIKGATSLWVRNLGFAEGIHFNEIGLFGYPDAASRRNSITLVESNGMPVLSYWRLGQGTVIYNGLEMNSDFYLRPEYPIFWYQMVNWITGVPDIEKSNHKTGELLHLGEILTVNTPTSTLTTSTLLLDEVGIYSFRGETIAANMNDPKESSLSRSYDIDVGKFQGKSKETTVEKDLSFWVIALAAFALLLEMAIMRWRREA
jgi:hypothetical protein